MLQLEFNEPGTRMFQFVIAQSYLDRLSDVGLRAEHQGLDPEWEFPTEYRLNETVGEAAAGPSTGRAILLRCYEAALRLLEWQ